MDYIFINTENPMYQQAAEMRYRVFFKPCKLGRDKVYDGLEEKSFHFICAREEEVLGYGRLTFEKDGIAAVSQLAVKESVRKKGIGKEILNRLTLFSKEKGYKKIVLGARIEARGFYEKQGFFSDGRVYPSEKTGLPHIKMEKAL